MINILRSLIDRFGLIDPNTRHKNLEKQRGKQLPLWRPSLSPCRCNAIQNTHTRNQWKGCGEGSSHRDKMERHIVWRKCSWLEGRFGANLLSILSAIKKAYFSKYITKRRDDKFSQYSSCKKLKRLWDAHTMGTESYVAHQLNYFKHVNTQEAHRNDYYINKALSISRPLEVLKVIHDKMDHAKTSSPCFANWIKTMVGFFKLPISITCEFGNDYITLPKHNFICFPCCTWGHRCIQNGSFKYVY